MNKLIKHLVESKFNFNIDIDNIDIDNVEQYNSNDICLSKQKSITFNMYEETLIQKCMNSLWNELNENDINYIKTHLNIKDKIILLLGSNEIICQTKKELKNNIINELSNAKSKILNLNKYNVSNITDFTRLFDIDKDLLKNVDVIDISLWDMTNAEKTNYMFAKINKPVCIYANLWNMQNVTDATGMFYLVSSKVKINIDFSTMKSLQIASRMFQGCKSQNVLSNVPKLYTSNIEDMSCMFLESYFNEDISNWDVSNVKDMRNIFYNNTKFNQDISNWNLDVNYILHNYNNLRYYDRNIKSKELLLKYLTNCFNERTDKQTLLTIDKIPNLK